MFGGPAPLSAREHCEGLLIKRECPQLTFWLSAEQGAWEAGLLKHPLSKAVVWEGSGHRLHEEKPGEFLLQLTGWLAGLADEGQGGS